MSDAHGGALTGRTATELAAGVHSGELSPTAIALQHLDRISRLDRRVRAFQFVADEAVGEQARAIEASQERARLPLAGVPVAVKDDLDMRGVPTRHGSLATADRLAECDVEPVRRLRAAGALLIGKTAVPELCLWPFTESAAFGATRNPWDLDHTPGGSTGGGGAAVAAAMTPLAIGSDGGGSIRLPAACCGLVGLKPGPGVVPQDLPAWVGMSERGPLATTVSDLALLLDVLAGTNHYRRVTPPRRGLRIAGSTTSPAPGVRVDAAVRAAFDATAQALAAAGHEMVEADPPYRATDAFAFLQRAFIGGADDAEVVRFEALESRTRAWVRTGRLLRRALPPRQRRADRIRARFEDWLAGYDLLLTPTTATPPPRIGAYQGKGLARTLLELTAYMPYTPLWNVVDFPAMSVPAGRTPDGLPLGVQLVAPRGGEPLLLSVALQLESIRPWPRHAPLEPQ